MLSEIVFRIKINLFHIFNAFFFRFFRFSLIKTEFQGKTVFFFSSELYIIFIQK